MNLYMLFAFVLYICTVTSQEAFLEAFPYANVSAFYELPKEALEDKELPVPTPLSFAACPTLPVPAADPINITYLKPGNVRVLMAMGDSITAGMSAKDTNILNLREYRGISYCIGADTGVTTFANILKPYTSALYGISTGIGTRTSAGNGLNGAVSGAINSDMLGQAQWLVTALKANTNINIVKDWKVLTLWIGSNNLCAVCNNDANNNGQNFQTQVEAALNYIQTNVPRVFVNLVANLDISTLYNINGGACNLLHSVECACVGTSDQTKRAKVSTTAQDYITRAYNIASKYNNLPEFAVVVQPFLSKNIITDRTLLSAADCFHPSALGHSLASVALWNNMLSPAAAKKTSWNANDVPICPDATSVFPTY